MITFMESTEKPNELDKSLDPQLWHACAGSMVQMPPVNSKVFYFPQGHAEHASENVDFRNIPRVPPFVPCLVSAVRFLADPETDEVFVKIGLSPVARHETNLDDNSGPAGLSGPAENQEKPASFAKTLTQSDANNGGGFSVPRYCAETIFPRLDYSADPPVQTILAKDVHGETWKFRHIYRGTPRRHLLTTGWSTFVNQKKLMAGDSIVFMRSESGDLCVGIRRAKRGIGPGGPEVQAGWNYGGFSAFLREDEGKMGRNGNGINGVLIGSKGRVRGGDVIEAVGRAVSGREFEVVYYPRASTPEFCVRAGLVQAAMQVRWCSGMRFKMAFETEDSSRISWFMGTVAAVQAADPIRWPDSPWRLLQVAWDEPDLLQNVKRVSPWLVELVSNMPAINLSPFSPPHKKLRLPGHPEFPLPPFSGGPFGGSCLPNSNSNNPPAGMQGARHAQYGLSLSDNSNNLPYPYNKITSTFLPIGYPPFDPTSPIFPGPCSGENVSCQLTMGSPARFQEMGKFDDGKRAPFVLFGQKILLDNRNSVSRSSDTINSSSDGCGDKNGNTSNGSGASRILVGLNLEPESCDGTQVEHGQCKVFMESEDVGRMVDLSSMGTYEELYQNLADLFSIEVSEIVNRVMYREATGTAKRVGHIPFSDFVKAARRLTILTDLSNEIVD